MSEKPVFKNAKELSDYLEELYKDADMMEDDQRILRYERLSIENKELHKNPEFRAEWQEKHKAGCQKRSDSAEWQENHKLAMQKLADSAEWQENVKIAVQKRSNTDEWQEKNKLGREKMKANVEWRKKNKVAHNKPISCDNVIYPSRKEAALLIAPVTRLTDNSKEKWLAAQMEKYPDRYFYIEEAGNKLEQQVDPKPVEEQVDPKSIDPAYMSLEERKALAKLKRQQDDTDK